MTEQFSIRAISAWGRFWYVNEGLLGPIGGVHFVLEQPDQVIEHPLRMARHQIVERGVVAGGLPRHEWVGEEEENNLRRTGPGLSA